MGTGNLNMTTIAEFTCFRPKKLNFTASKLCLNVSACGNAGLVEDAVSSFCFSAVLQADSHVGEHNLCLCVFSQKGIAGLKPEFGSLPGFSEKEFWSKLHITDLD